MHNNLTINILQNLLFCVPKAALLHGKSVCFAAQKSRFRNAKAQLSFLRELSLQNQGCFSASDLSGKKKIVPQSISTEPK
ncbi:hypothetical protein CTM46_01345 [Prevotella intermedia]|uniref:Uncharacterized protein n=1 Tax=Prevotella intermedia TaxID=28131 RepID=A0A2D3LI46_PREIN|nr:hypothetical protein CTM46_01345 [Prevotella intermedia]